MIIPSKRDFLDKIRYGKIPPIFKDIPYNYPQDVYETFASPNSFLLESVKGPEKIARYSFIGFNPCLIYTIKNGLIEIINPDNRFIYNQTEYSIETQKEKEKKILSQMKMYAFKSKLSKKPLNILKRIITGYKQKPYKELPPFQGGVVGLLSYDFVQYLEELPKETLDDLNIHDAYFLLIDKVIAFDHLEKKCWIIISPGVKESLRDNNIQDKIDWSEKYDEAECNIEIILKKVRNRRLRGPLEIYKYKLKNSNRQNTIDINYEMKKNDYIDIVKRAKEYIAAGDIFQANLSQRVSAYIKDRRPWKLYKILSSINPSPFAAFVDFGNYQIVSSSPERLLRVNNGIIETRPIAGTRPRGKNIEEDILMRKELLLNEKERAEHIMLIDLERNDIGRVSYYGTVNVDELMITEDYSHVIHIVSNIRGVLEDKKDCFDAIKAAFPGGTITGVPKVRCMEIIEELEPVKRGPYTGSLGYISFTGNMDLNIIIRTFVIKNEIAYVQVGAGIVADSDPEREYYETLKKAEALIRTLERV